MFRFRVTTTLLTGRTAGTWDGTFKWAWSNNPAWVLYDLIMNQRYGLDQRELGIPVDKWSLYEVSQYCDELVPDNRGGMEPRYLMDMVVQSQVEALPVGQGCLFRIPWNDVLQR
ncbi:hypothetical protein EEPDABAO_00084 [Klebsiella phage mfs]|uniref:Uncharacterized protein n=1 Tax=Klebsiella phage mfs TaxID=2985561 RepID=A0A9X9JWL7_9CAUD|nr:hypothetical protein EEPDABAO_00084 [Klebsiella phage mfs]